jgi:hypothetical protein
METFTHADDNKGSYREKDLINETVEDKIQSLTS